MENVCADKDKEITNLKQEMEIMKVKMSDQVKLNDKEAESKEKLQTEIAELRGQCRTLQEIAHGPPNMQNIHFMHQRNSWSRIQHLQQQQYNQYVNHHGYQQQNLYFGNGYTNPRSRHPNQSWNPKFAQ